MDDDYGSFNKKHIETNLNIFEDILLVFKVLSVVLNLLFQISNQCLVVFHRFLTLRVVSFFRKHVTTNSTIPSIGWLGFMTEKMI